MTPTPNPTRRFSVAWLMLLVLLALVALVAIEDCARPREAVARETPRETPHVVTADGDAFSVYDVGGRWREQTGATRSLESFRGAPVLLAMIYTHCSATCPIAVSELKRVAALAPDVRLVLVSLDPARDDPAQLTRYAAERALDPARWTLLTGSDAAVRDLAATLSVRYRRVTADDLAHSNLVTFLDREGRIVRQTSERLDDAAIAELRAASR
jgi:protein SCO1/2